MATQFKNGIDVTKSVTATAAVATDNALVIKAASGQSANLVEFRDSANGVTSQITSNGGIAMGSGTLISAGNGRGLFIVNSDAVALTAKGSSGQTTNLQEWQNSSGTVLASFDKNANLMTRNAAVNEAPTFGSELLTTWTNNGGWGAPPAWVTGTSYQTTAPASVVTNGGNAYVCAVAHTSGTFATDLAAGKWTLLGTSAAASGATVYQHTSGVTTLTNAYTPSASLRHALVMTVVGMSAGSFTINYGGNNGSQTYQSNNTYTFAPTTTASPTNLTVTPSSTFDGTIAFSLKSITGTSTAPYQMMDSTGTTLLELRSPGNNTSTNNLGLFIGRNSGRYAYSGTASLSSNVGIGHSSLLNLTSGYGNHAIGSSALGSVTSSIYNIGIGPSTGNAITTGSYNIAIGGVSLNSVTTSSSNIGIGGYGALQSTTGSNSIGIGTYAGNALTTGSNNTFIGTQSGYSGQGAVTVSNAIGIGYLTNTSSTNQAVLGNQSITQTKLQGELIVGGGVSGSIVMPYRAISTNTTLTYTDYTVDCTGTITVTLPLAAGATATTTATQATTGSYTIVVASASNIQVGSVVSAVGTGLPVGTFVTGVSGTTITLNTPTTAAMSSTSITFIQQGNASANATVGRIYNIKNSGTGVVTIATTSSQTIDGVTSILMDGSAKRYQTTTVQSTGSGWIIL